MDRSKELNLGTSSEALPLGLTELTRLRVLRLARHINWSEDGAFLAVPLDTGSGGEVAIWSDNTGKIESIIDCDGLPTVAHVWSKTGEVVYGNQTGQLVVCKSRQFGNIEKRVLPLHKDTISQVQWSPDGQFFAAASHDQTISVVPRSADARGIRRIQSTRERHNSLKWSPTGREIVVCGSYYGAKLVNVEAGNEIWQTDRGINLNFLDIA